MIFNKVLVWSCYAHNLHGCTLQHQNIKLCRAGEYFSGRNLKKMGKIETRRIWPEASLLFSWGRNPSLIKSIKKSQCFHSLCGFCTQFSNISDSYCSRFNTFCLNRNKKSSEGFLNQFFLSECSSLYTACCLSGVKLVSSGSPPLSLFQSLRPSGRLVSSSKLPVPSTNSSYVDFSWKGRWPSSSTMSALSSTSFSNRRFPTWGRDQEWASTNKASLRWGSNQW